MAVLSLFGVGFVLLVLLLAQSATFAAGTTASGKRQAEVPKHAP